MKSLESVRSLVKPLFTGSHWQTLGEYLGIGRKQNKRAVTDLDSLAEFLDTRASHVAQSSLYGYLRTRAGTRFPEMFENPDLLQSINIAKWHIWLACVSDLCLYTGQFLYQSGKLDESTIRRLLADALQRIFDNTGEPQEAGPDFNGARARVLQRVSTCDWTVERDDDTIFSQSPEALFYWSPIADELKERDELIVKNSIRFRWIEVRRGARELLDCAALAEYASAPASTSA